MIKRFWCHEFARAASRLSAVPGPILYNRFEIQDIYNRGICSAFYSGHVYVNVGEFQQISTGLYLATAWQGPNK